MSARGISGVVVQEPPVLAEDDRVDAAVEQLLASGLPALPVVDRHEPVRAHIDREHIDVGPDFSDTQVAEIFLPHNVLVVAILEDRRPVRLLPRIAFFGAVAERFVESSRWR